MARTNMRSNHLVNIFQYQITVNIASLFAPHFSSTKFWIFLVTNHAIRYCSQLGQSSKFWGTVTGWVLKDFWESRKSFSGKNCFFRGFRIWQLCPFYQVYKVLINSTFAKNVQFWICSSPTDLSLTLVCLTHLAKLLPYLPLTQLLTQ